MAKDLQGFLNALFASEGGGNLSIINKFGYVGKYQFGEDALMDLGYFNHDGQKHEKDGKFFQDWDGTWTGKDGATSLQVFRNSEAIQDKAARPGCGGCAAWAGSMARTRTSGRPLAGCWSPSRGSSPRPT